MKITIISDCKKNKKQNHQKTPPLLHAPKTQNTQTKPKPR